jgi:hypothetical protein
MKKRCKSILIIGLSLLSGTNLFAQAQKSFTKNFLHPPEDAKPWVYWYWMEGAVSEYGIKADLIAMKEDGIGGAYLMPVLGPSDSPLVHPPVTQLSPLWWTMIKYAMHEADSLSVKLAMHVCDGFATAGGPWITPALSMQKVVWSELNVQGVLILVTLFLSLKLMRAIIKILLFSHFHHLLERASQLIQ